MTHCELVTVRGEFHPHKTHFISLFLNMVSHHQKCLRSSLLNADETPTVIGLIACKLVIIYTISFVISLYLILLITSDVTGLYQTLLKSSPLSESSPAHLSKPRLMQIFSLNIRIPVLHCGLRKSCKVPQHFFYILSRNFRLWMGIN